MAIKALLLCLLCRLTSAALIHNITRVFNNGDIFNNPDVNCRPMHCSVYGANPARNSGCNCQCPLSRPAFLQHVKKCADSISDCRMIYFGIYGQTESRLRMPTVFLPLTGQLLSPSLPLDWTAAGIKPDQEYGTIPCTLSSIGFLTQSGWIPLENANLFSLLNSNQHTHIQTISSKWLGNKQDQQALTGKIVEVSLQCEDAETPDMCAVFRVIGQDVEMAETTGANQSAEKDERNNQLGLIVGIVCGVILAMSLAVITVFWTICWKQQKERLSKKIQMHLLLQQRLQEQNSRVFRHFPRPYNSIQEAVFQNYPANGYGVYASGSHGWSESNAGGNVYKGHSGMTPPPPYATSRKRLHFNPEFFEPEKMANPPPHAEQFLNDVRSMIDTARTRIRGRRYTPSLVGIPEEERSSASSAEAEYDKSAGVHFRRKYSKERRADLNESDAICSSNVPEKVAIWLSRQSGLEPTSKGDVHGVRNHKYYPARWNEEASFDQMNGGDQSMMRRASCPSIAPNSEIWPKGGGAMSQDTVALDNTYYSSQSPFDHLLIPVPVEAFDQLPYSHSLPLSNTANRRPAIVSFFSLTSGEDESKQMQKIADKTIHHE